MRLSDWPARLSSYFLSCQDRKFSYREGFNCGTFATGAIEALTGIDPSESIPHYTTSKEARAALKHVCGSSSMEGIAECLSARYGFPEINPAFAQVGDVVLVGSGMRSRLAVV